MIPVEFIRAYAKALHTHSIRPAEFAAFLDGLNILCHATSATPSTLLPLSPPSTSTHPGSSDIVQTYLDTSNSDFFAPRGLRVSIHSLNALLTSLAIPTDRGQRAAAAATALDPNASDSQRCDALHP